MGHCCYLSNKNFHYGFIWMKKLITVVFLWKNIIIAPTICQLPLSPLCATHLCPSCPTKEADILAGWRRVPRQPSWYTLQEISDQINVMIPRMYCCSKHQVFMTSLGRSACTAHQTRNTGTTEKQRGKLMTMYWAIGKICWFFKLLVLEYYLINVTI